MTVSADADPADYPELVERVMSHREKIVEQIASLQQVLDFIDMKLEEGRYRGDCPEQGRDGNPDQAAGEVKGKEFSPSERSYFPARATR